MYYIPYTVASLNTLIQFLKGVILRLENTITLTKVQTFFLFVAFKTHLNLVA